jgi:hypothetical protein
MKSYPRDPGNALRCPAGILAAAIRRDHFLFFFIYTDFLARMANIKIPTPISNGTLSHLPARSRWMDWNMRIIQRNELESIGAAVTSGIRLWKATAPTALHNDYAPERPERRSRMWAVGSRGSGSSELGIPPEISIYSEETILSRIIKCLVHTSFSPPHFSALRVPRVLKGSVCTPYFRL